MENLREMVRRIVREIISSERDENKEEIIEDAQILNEAGLDSLSFVKLLVALEDELDIEFDYDYLVLDNFKTINNIVESISDQMERK